MKKREERIGKFEKITLFEAESLCHGSRHNVYKRLPS